MRYHDVNCEICKNTFILQVKYYNSRRRINGYVFCCSKECRKLYRHTKNHENIPCLECGNNFIRSKNFKRKRKFCSQSCSGMYAQRFCNPQRVSEGLKRFYLSKAGLIRREKQGEKTRKYKNCPQCLNKFYGGKVYCSLKCMKISTAIKISTTRKEMFLNGQLNVTGGNTKWLNYKNIRVQGSYEYRTCVILDKLKKLNLITDWNKSNFRIKYIGEDEAIHTYLMDFEIITKTNKKLYLEVKGYIKPNDILKWKTVKSQNYPLLIWMNNHLIQIEKKLKIIAV